MTPLRPQTRGHCQVCGAVQSVRRGRIARHGYAIDGSGSQLHVCPGFGLPPIELDRATLDRTLLGLAPDAPRAILLGQLAATRHDQPLLLERVPAYQPHVHMGGGRYGRLCISAAGYANRPGLLTEDWKQVTCPRCRARRRK